jgi:hypothetical protein
MTTSVRFGVDRSPLERVRPGSLPTAPDSAVRVQSGRPSQERKGVLAALLAKIHGPAATQRERNRIEAYQDLLKGYGSLANVTYPRL